MFSYVTARVKDHGHLIENWLNNYGRLNEKG